MTDDAHPLSTQHDYSRRLERHLRVARDYAAKVPIDRIATEYGLAPATGVQHRAPPRHQEAV